jgi:hypothetical protein
MSGKAAKWNALHSQRVLQRGEINEIINELSAEEHDNEISMKIIRRFDAAKALCADEIVNLKRQLRYVEETFCFVPGKLPHLIAHQDCPPTMEVVTERVGDILRERDALRKQLQGRGETDNGRSGELSQPASEGVARQSADATGADTEPSADHGLRGEGGGAS